MTRSDPYALTLSKKVLRVLMILNPVIGLMILALLVATYVDPTLLQRALGVKSGPGSETLFNGMRSIAALGVLAVALAQVVLRRLDTIVETVAIGNPFIIENAERLKTIAWTVVALEVIHLVIGAIAKGVSSNVQPLDIDWNFSVTRWLAILLCFVLARVFEQGARMRDDLEGTI